MPVGKGDQMNNRVSENDLRMHARWDYSTVNIAMFSAPPHNVQRENAHWLVRFTAFILESCEIRISVNTRSINQTYQCKNDWLKVGRQIEHEVGDLRSSICSSISRQNPQRGDQQFLCLDSEALSLDSWIFPRVRKFTRWVHASTPYQESWSKNVVARQDSRRQESKAFTRVNRLKKQQKDHDKKYAVTESMYGTWKLDWRSYYKKVRRHNMCVRNVKWRYRSPGSFAMSMLTSATQSPIKSLMSVRAQMWK